MKQGKPYLVRLNKKAKIGRLPLIFVAKMYGEETDRGYIYLYGHCDTSTTKVHKRCFLCDSKLKTIKQIKAGCCVACYYKYYNTFNSVSLLKHKIDLVYFGGWVKKSDIKTAARGSYIIRDKENPYSMMKNAALFNDNEIEVTHAFNAYLFETVSFLEGYRFSKGRHGFRKFVHLTTTNYHALKMMGFAMAPEIEAKVVVSNRLPFDKIIYKDWKIKRKIKGLLLKPYGFQAIGTEFIIQKNGRVLLADDMGLGKTLQVIAYIQKTKIKGTIIIICPATLKFNWFNELNKALKKPVIQVLEGRKNLTLNEAPIKILNYDILPNRFTTTKIKDKVTGKMKTIKTENKDTGWIDFLCKLKPELLVIDECHYVKTPDSNRTKAVKKLSVIAPKFIAISATPLENGPQDIFHISNMVQPGYFPNYVKFVERYCSAKRDRYKRLQLGKSINLAELHYKLDGVIMIRRLKENVLTELPNKTYNFIPLQITNRAEYEEAEEAIITYLDKILTAKSILKKKELKTHLKKITKTLGSNIIEANTAVEQYLSEYKADKLEKAKSAQAVIQFEILKQLCAAGKMDGFYEWVDNFLISGNKLIIFAEHRTIIKQVLERYSKIAVSITGSTPTGKIRTDIVTRFQEDPEVRIIVGNRAMQEGVTLTASFSVAHVEYPWTGSALAQRNDRAHRIGQANAVGIYYFMAANTVDERIAKILDEKIKIASAVLDGKAIPNVPILKELLKTYSKKISKNR